MLSVVETEPESVRRCGAPTVVGAAALAIAAAAFAAIPSRAQKPGPVTETSRVRLRVSPLPDRPQGAWREASVLGLRDDTVVVSVLRGPRPFLSDTVRIPVPALQPAEVYGPLPARASCGGAERLAAQPLAGLRVALAGAFLATIPPESFEGALVSAIGGAAVGGALGVYMAGIAGDETASLASTLGGAAGGSLLFLSGAHGDPDRSTLLYVGPMLALPVAGALASYHVTCRPRRLGWLPVPLEGLELIVGPTPGSGLGVVLRSRIA